MFHKFYQYSLKKQLLIAFFLISLIFCLITVLSCILFITLTNQFIINNSIDYFNDQISNHSSIIINENSLLLESILNRGDHGFVSILANAMKDTFRPNYSMGYSPSYFDYTYDYLSPPLTTDDRQNKNVSFSHSSFYVPHSYPQSISNFSTNLNDTIDKSANLDSFFVSLYKNNKEYVGTYIGFLLEGLFRYYPGSSTIENDPNRNYDPRFRKWFTSAINNSNNLVYTAPYLSYRGKGWMITLAKIVEDYENKTIGVAGSDLLINDINKIISNIKFLNTGKITLFDKEGTVIADREWNLESNFSLSYKDLKNPEINDETWNIIQSTNRNEFKNYDYNDYILTIRHLDIDNYYLVVFINKQEINKNIDNILSEINKINIITTSSLSAGFILLVIIILFIILMTTYKIIKPFDIISKNINTMVKNIGNDNLFEGLETIPKGLCDEINELGNKFNDMQTNLKNNRTTNNIVEINNYDYNFIKPSAPPVDDKE